MYCRCTPGHCDFAHPSLLEGCPRELAARDASGGSGTQDVVVLSAAKNSVRGLWRTMNWMSCLQCSTESTQLSIATRLRLVAMRTPTTLLRTTLRLTNGTQMSGACEAVSMQRRRAWVSAFIPSLFPKLAVFSPCCGACAYKHEVCRMNPELARRVAQLALERCEARDGR